MDDNNDMTPELSAKIHMAMLKISELFDFIWAADDVEAVVDSFLEGDLAFQVWANAIHKATFKDLELPDTIPEDWRDE